MPETTTTIDRDQRDGLYELIRNHLGSIEDFWVALERTRDFAKAEQLGLEFAEDFRLLKDIGWAERDERETFGLTMPPHDLMELLKRLHDEAVKILVGSGGSEARPCRRPSGKCLAGRLRKRSVLRSDPARLETTVTTTRGRS